MSLFGAGSIRIKQEKIEFISNESGHYRPCPYTLRKVLGLFRNKYHVNIDTIDIKYYYLNTIINEKSIDFMCKDFTNKKNHKTN